MRRGLWFLATAALGGGAVSAAVASGACIVAPPADLPNVTHRPIVLHGSVVPPEDQLLTAWPGDSGFIVPVQFLDPDPTYVWSVFVDDVRNNTQRATSPGALATDGGTYLITVTVDSSQLDLTRCHVIKVLVGHDFAPDLRGAVTTYRLFDDDQYDQITWFYSPAGSAGCASVTVEAGALGDASDEVLSLAPESGPVP